MKALLFFFFLFYLANAFTAVPRCTGSREDKEGSWVPDENGN